MQISFVKQVLAFMPGLHLNFRDGSELTDDAAEGRKWYAILLHRTSPILETASCEDPTRVLPAWSHISYVIMPLLDTMKQVRYLRRTRWWQSNAAGATGQIAIKDRPTVLSVQKGHEGDTRLTEDRGDDMLRINLGTGQGRSRGNSHGRSCAMIPFTFIIESRFWSKVKDIYIIFCIVFSGVKRKACLFTSG